MRVLEKMNLIEAIASNLQQRFTFSDIDLFLGEFDVNDEDPYANYDSKRVYVKDRLTGVSPAELARIANEIAIDAHSLASDPPANWQQSDSAKAFISHIASDKHYATRLRDVFKRYNIDGFVAHEDIRPSEEWQNEITKALNTMDFFVSIHTKGFAESNWCQQEVGFAVARNVKIIPVKFNEDPSGFIGKIQALARRSRTADDVVVDLLSILQSDERTKDLYKEKVTIQPDDDEIPF